MITVEFDVPATMRDGTVLRANVFRPAGEGTYPVALTRTPYGKDYASASPVLDALRLARAGYIVVIQDVRGRFTSDGAWVPYRHDGADGYDSVEWAAGLPGSNGNVGMFGASYYGFTQWVTAVEQPPHLKALVPFITWADSRDGGTWRGGAFELGKVAYWQVATIAFDVLRRRYKDAPRAELATPGRAIARFTDLGYGARVRALFAPDGPDGDVPDDLFQAAVKVLAAWDWGERPVAVVSIDSRTRPQIVHSIAARLAKIGRLPYLGGVRHTGASSAGRSNSAQRLRAVYGAYRLPDELATALPGLGGKPLLLVDDRTDSGWTLTVVTQLLRQAGAGPVYPFTLAVEA